MFINEVELFKGIASHIIDDIAKIVIEEDLPAGETLFHAGDIADTFYILEEGEIRLLIAGEKGMNFQVNKPASVFGWSALVEPNRYTASARTTKKSKVIKLDSTRLMHIFGNHPAEGLTVMKRLAGITGSRLVNCYKRLVS